MARPSETQGREGILCDKPLGKRKCGKKLLGDDGLKCLRCKGILSYRDLLRKAVEKGYLSPEDIEEVLKSIPELQKLKLEQRKSKMWTIPTISDVKDRDYREARRINDIRSRIWFWGGVTSACNLHNQVVEVLRSGGDDVLRAEELYQGKSDKLSKRSEDLLNPFVILCSDLNHIWSCRKLIEDVRQYLDREIWLEIPGQIEIESPAITGVSPSKERAGYYKYIYNPYELAIETLSKLQRELRKAFDSSKDKLVQIQAIWKVHKELEDSPLKHFFGYFSLDSLIRDRNEKDSSDFERDPNSEAHKLKKEHERIAKKSDIYLDFEEGAFPMWRGTSGTFAPLGCLTDQTKLTDDNLEYREKLRAFIIEKMIKNSQEGRGFSIVINGATIIYRLGSHQWQADVEVPQEIVNLLGFPVKAKNGLLLPEAWAVEELYLIKMYTRFKKLEEKEALKDVAQRFFELYRGFVEKYGTVRSEEEAIERLEEAIRANGLYLPH